MESSRCLDRKGRLRVGLWMVERFTLFGVTFQNWIIPAMIIILVGATDRMVERASQGPV